MQVFSVQNTSSNPSIKMPVVKKQAYTYHFEKNLYDEQITFTGLASNLVQIKPLLLEHPQLTEEKFHSAQAYLQKSIENGAHWYKKKELLDADLSKLNGLQYGIKVFTGMTMKEIAFLFGNLHAIATNRGCFNKCIHCYAEAEPKTTMMRHNLMTEMAYEDFESVINGISELNNRLGFNPLKQYRKTITPSLFYDSDCIDLEMKNNSGETIDFRQLNDLFCEKVGLKSIFDTSGWTPKNSKLQKRAEAIVKYFLTGDNKNKAVVINLSINPFHALNVASVEAQKAGDFAKAKKFRDLYTDRMANAMYTFVPLIPTGKLRCILLAVKGLTGFKGYREKDLRSLIDEILEKVQAKYPPEQAEQALHDIRYFRQITTKIGGVKPQGRAQKLFMPVSGDQLKNAFKQFRRLFSLKHWLRTKGWYAVIDANGEIFLTSYTKNVPTELQLNFINRGRLTKKPPNQPPNSIVTKKQIEEAY